MCVRGLVGHRNKHGHALPTRVFESGDAPSRDEQADRAAGDHQRACVLSIPKVTQLSPPSLTMCAWLYKVLEASLHPSFAQAAGFATRLFQNAGGPDAGPHNSAFLLTAHQVKTWLVPACGDIKD